MNRRGFLACLAGGAGLALAGSVTEEAAAWSFPKWNRRLVYVHSTLPHAWYAGTATEAWDDSSALELVTVYDPPPSASSVVKISYGTLPTGVLGYTARAYDGMGRIKAARVTINQTINLDRFDKARRVALIRHEIGHALGFNHSRTGLDVMYGEIHPGGPTGLSDFHKTRLAEVYPR